MAGSKFISWRELAVLTACVVLMLERARATAPSSYDTAPTPQPRIAILTKTNDPDGRSTDGFDQCSREGQHRRFHGVSSNGARKTPALRCAALHVAR